MVSATEGPRPSERSDSGVTGDQQSTGGGITAGGVYERASEDRPMTSEQLDIEALVLRTAEGTYYAIPRRLLEQCRVPDAAVALLEERLGQVDEVKGYNLSPVIDYPGVYLTEIPGAVHPIAGVPTTGGRVTRWTRWP